MTSLGAPLAVFSGTTICDTKHEHEARLITDGFRAYAYGLEVGATDSGSPVLRWDTGAYTASCGQPGRGSYPDYDDGDPCEGTLRWEPTDGDWTADDEALALLNLYGATVER